MRDNRNLELCLTKKEVAVVQACLFYTNHDDVFTQEAQKIVDRMLNKLNMDNRVLSLKVFD